MIQLSQGLGSKTNVETVASDTDDKHDDKKPSMHTVIASSWKSNPLVKTITKRLVIQLFVSLLAGSILSATAFTYIFVKTELTQSSPKGGSKFLYAFMDNKFPLLFLSKSI